MWHSFFDSQCTYSWNFVRRHRLLFSISNKQFHCRKLACLRFNKSRRSLICIDVIQSFREILKQEDKLSLGQPTVLHHSRLSSEPNQGVPRRQPHRRQAQRPCHLWELSPSHPILLQTRGLAVLLCVYRFVCALLSMSLVVFVVFFVFCSISFSTLILLVGSFDL